MNFWMVKIYNSKMFKFAQKPIYKPGQVWKRSFRKSFQKPNPILAKNLYLSNILADFF